jgi:HEAT repeat protein
LAACGPVPSDQAPSLESRASVAGPSELPALSPKNPSPHPPPLAAPLASNHEPTPDVKEEPAPLPEQLVLPQWIAQALASPEVPVRLRALDLWAQRGPEAPLDPLIVALDDADDDVRTKAMALIERQWAVAQETEQ